MPTRRRWALRPEPEAPGLGSGERQEAVAMYRKLAQADPDRYRPDLAASLGVLADSLDLLGRGGDGSAARSEAAALTGGPPGTESADQPTR